MLRFKNNGVLIQSIDELPEIAATTLYIDFETTSGSPKETSTNPWHFCDILGICITWDSNPEAYYIPLGHHDEEANLPREEVIAWYQKVLAFATSWVNHNIKYDVHVSANTLDTLPPADLKLVDTLTAAKLIDSDRLIYSLKRLSKEWLHEDIDKYEQAFAPFLGRANKDYGAIPADLMAEYGCQDVLTVRRLYSYLCAQMPESVRPVWEMEISMTRVLVDIERTGLAVTPSLDIEELKILNELLQLEQQLVELVGREFKPNSNKDCFEVLCNQYGLPILGQTESGNPSFDKHALIQYRAHPLAPVEVVEKIIQYRKLHTLLSMFINAYQKLKIDNILHSNYNQLLRTARLSCSQPNAQQLSKRAKELIVPRQGNSFLSVDYSQIEFRLIVHYINDKNCIQAYIDNPDVDFHKWVAEELQIKRRPAKTINFTIAFGAGKATVVAALELIMELVGDLKNVAVELATKWCDAAPGTSAYNRYIIDTFTRLARERGEAMYNTYHETLPGIKQCSYRASDAVKRRGYVFNLYGRRRHLPAQRAHIAFNTLNQSSAGDLMKERAIACWKMIQGTPIRLVATVHDELLFEGPTEIIEDPRTISDIVSCMEHPAIEKTLRVPIRCSYGLSRKHWREAADGEERIPFNTPCNNLKHLL